MSIEANNQDFSMKVSRKAPRFLDDNGMPLTDDTLNTTWEALSEAFSRLHGQRIYELMHALLHEVPKDEKVILEWEGDEIYLFYLRFCNGWSLSAYTDDCDFPAERHEHRSDAVAPAWFPRTQDGLVKWKTWHNYLHNYSINASVDAIVFNRLYALSDQKGGLSRKDLPDIEHALVGPEWGSSLEYMEISAQTNPGAKKHPTKTRRI